MYTYVTHAQFLFYVLLNNYINLIFLTKIDHLKNAQSNYLS